MNQFNGVYRDRPVLVTGHTGFKGSWLSIWLNELGAAVAGFSLPEPPTRPSNFEVCRLGEHLLDRRGDVRNLDSVRDVIVAHQPEIVFHLAAQPLVLEAYQNPTETFEVNVGGTVNVLEMLRTVASVKAAVIVTTDKVYENREWLWGYRENDRLGGHDPYSASKAMAEMAVTSYRRSFFGEGGPAVAAARAGNVIGGGDFAPFRLLPDSMRALMAEEPIRVRHPSYVRPWQHVLESLSGYLWLGARLLEQGKTFAGAWNFGPLETEAVTAQRVVEKAIALWGGGEWLHTPDPEPPKETTTLRLSWEKAANQLGWRPVYAWDEAIAETVAWFKSYQQDPVEEMYARSVAQIRAYTERAADAGLLWAKDR